jgi:hypothetical protein
MMGILGRKGTWQKENTEALLGTSKQVGLETEYVSMSAERRAGTNGNTRAGGKNFEECGRVRGLIWSKILAFMYMAN